MAAESRAQGRIVLEAGNLGFWLSRNNVGALRDAKGRVVRYGLANETAALNRRIKSGDLIGIRQVLIEPHHVGMTLGQFASVEVKEPGWTYSGRGREPAQLAWIEHVRKLGGFACFADGPEGLTVAHSINKLSNNF